MGDSVWIWPSADMDFWKINNEETSVIIKRSRNCFEDYKALSYHFYECGYKTFADVIESGHDNVKKVIELESGGYELFGWAWNKENQNGQGE